MKRRDPISTAMPSIVTGVGLTAAAFAAVAALNNTQPTEALPPIIDRGEAGCITDSECFALEHDRVLIGFGCGPEKVTTYAVEEDEFRFDSCDVIEPRRVVGSFKRGA
jgi:NAD(P)H-hydrate repair Nnr-like enzyme with NAD(P)H-hydrate dehydratase domain